MTPVSTSQLVLKVGGKEKNYEAVLLKILTKDSVREWLRAQGWRGAWVAQLVKHPTSAQVMIS